MRLSLRWTNRRKLMWQGEWIRSRLPYHLPFGLFLYSRAKTAGLW